MDEIRMSIIQKRPFSIEKDRRRLSRYDDRPPEAIREGILRHCLILEKINWAYFTIEVDLGEIHYLYCSCTKL